MWQRDENEEEERVYVRVVGMCVLVCVRVRAYVRVEKQQEWKNKTIRVVLWKSLADWEEATPKVSFLRGEKDRRHGFQERFSFSGFVTFLLTGLSAAWKRQ